MSDDDILTDDNINGLRTLLCDPEPNTMALTLCRRQLRVALDELQRRRAEQAAGREHVERVVMEEVICSVSLTSGSDGVCGNVITDSDQLGDAIARRVADRLSVPVLSNELGDRMQLWNAINAYACGCGGDTAKYVYGHSHRQEQVRLIEEALDRLIAAGKP